MRVEEVLRTGGPLNAVQGGRSEAVNLSPVITSDATVLEPELHPLYDRVCLNDLPDIEGDLSPEDVARLLFLTMDWDESPALVLKKSENKMKLNHEVRSSSTGNGSLTEWAQKYSNNSSWKHLFLESLAAIGRLDILHILGFDEEEIEALQKPICLSSAKVAINAVCCNLLQTEVEELVQYVSSHHLPSDSKAFPDGYSIKHLLELHILYWMDKEIMNMNNLSVLEKALRGIGKQDIAKILTKPLSKTYPNKTGACVIFNQEEFDCVNAKCDLLHEDPKGVFSHRPRMGSSGDARELELLFAEFGCRTQIFTDLKCSEIAHLLEALSKAEDLDTFDYLVVCFLSHGNTDSRGKQLIYSSDCQKLLLEDELVRCFEAGYCTALDGKLKLVVTQSCMGTNSLPVITAVADGPNSLPVTAQRDYLFCQAATPGFMAYRIPSEGSLYIQMLCLVLREIGDREDLVHCILEVHKRLSVQSISLLDPDQGEIICALQPQMVVRTRAKFYFVRSSGLAGGHTGVSQDRRVWEQSPKQCPRSD